MSDKVSPFWLPCTGGRRLHCREIIQGFGRLFLENGGSLRGNDFREENNSPKASPLTLDFLAQRRTFAAKKDDTPTWSLV